MIAPLLFSPSPCEVKGTARQDVQNTRLKCSMTALFGMSGGRPIKRTTKHLDEFKFNVRVLRSRATSRFALTSKNTNGRKRLLAVYLSGVEVLQASRYLEDQSPRVSLRQLLPLPQKTLQVSPAAVVQDRGEGIATDLEHVREVDDARVPHLLMDLGRLGDGKTARVLVLPRPV